MRFVYVLFLFFLNKLENIMIKFTGHCRSVYRRVNVKKNDLKLYFDESANL